MNGSPWHFALRELRDVAGAKRFWLIGGTIGIILGLTGPFSTFERLPLLPRIAYWLAIAFSTYLIGTFCVGVFRRLPLIRRLGTQPRLMAAGGFAGVPIAVVVFLIGFVSPPDPRRDFADFAELAFYCILISGLVAATNGLVAEWLGERESENGGETFALPLMKRLPPEKRGRLIRLEATDHYVEVHTERGVHLVLMRLADAIAETGSVDGVQVHRSHWVASEAIASAAREAGRAHLRLINNTTIPVSRTRISDLKARGYFN